MALDFSGQSAVVVENGGALGSRIAEQLATQGAAVQRGADIGILAREITKDAPDVLVVSLESAVDGSVVELDPKEVSTALEQALMPAVAAVAAFLPRMRVAGRGRIVLCASSAGIYGASAGVAQGIAAAGLITLGRSLAIANIDKGIAVNILSYVAATPAADWLFKAHPMLRPQLFPVDVLVPAVTFLAHGSCTLNGEVISAAAGRFAKLFTSVTLGGFDPAIEDDGFAALMPKIADVRSTVAPRTIVDELITVVV